MGKYEHIIWDWNGTLLDDVKICVETINQVLAKRKLNSLTIEKYKNLFDFPVKDYYEKIGFDFTKESFDLVGAEYMIEYNLKVPSSNLRSGISEVLNIIKDKNISQSVVSAREQTPLIMDLDYFGVLDFFQSIVGLKNHHATGKIENLCKFVTSLNLDLTKIVLIGDTYHDFEAANAASIDCLLLTNGHHTYAKLSKAGVPLIENNKQLLMALEIE